MKKLVSVTSRTGRQFQKYNQGCRQVVGCIPYRYKNTLNSASLCGTCIDDVEVLLISSQKSSRLMFPKGGWEIDESIEDAASRETFEEAGVQGHVECELGIWHFKSNSQSIFHEGRMLPLLVNEEFEEWPEKNRQRVWMSVDQARQVCCHSWMKEALEVFVDQFLSVPRKQKESGSPCSLEYLMAEELNNQNGAEDVDLCVLT